MTGTSLAAVNRFQAVAITEKARDRFDAKQVELIRHTVAADCNNAELAIFLEECARLELDPFAKQIWAIKLSGKMQIIVSRDGLLLLANRNRDFRGCQSFEVREHDRFKVRTDENGHVHVAHEWCDANGEPTHGGKDGMLRGEIVGAFAYVRREGHVDTQFFAYRSQYDKGVNVWKSHPSAMIIKCAEGMALRKAFSITGITVEGELTEEQRLLTAPGSPVEIDFGEDEALAEGLQQAFRELGYTRAKVRMMMRGVTTDEARAELLQQLRTELDDAEVIDGEIAA